MCLKHAIYELKQAALVWWKALDKYMATLGCTCLLYDPGLFIDKEKNLIIIVYVNNVLFVGANKKDISSLKECFMWIWECRDLGETNEFLHKHITRSEGCILTDQEDYLQKVLQFLNLIYAKLVPTPLPEGYQPQPNKGSPDPEICTSYQHLLIGSLLYIMIGTWPDVAYAVTKLLQFAANPTQDHLNRALYICHYLQYMVPLIMP